MNDTPNIPDVKVGVNVNVDAVNWLYYILRGEKTIETRPASVASQWKKHVGERIGLVRTTTKPGRIPTGLLVGTALLVEVRRYRSKKDYDKDLQKHLYKISDWENEKKCWLVLEDVVKLERPMLLKPKGQASVREIEFA